MIHKHGWVKSSFRQPNYLKIVYEVDFSRALRLGVNLPQAWLLSSIPDSL